MKKYIFISRDGTVRRSEVIGKGKDSWVVKLDLPIYGSHIAYCYFDNPTSTRKVFEDIESALDHAEKHCHEKIKGASKIILEYNDKMNENANLAIAEEDFHGSL